MRYPHVRQTNTILHVTRASIRLMPAWYHHVIISISSCSYHLIIYSFNFICYRTRAYSYPSWT